jgi:hypothetical protein
MKKKFNCKTGDLLQSLVSLHITNDDDSDCEAEPGDLFLVYHVNYDGEYTLFSPKEQKYSTWEPESIQDTNYFCKID